MIRRRKKSFFKLGGDIYIIIITMKKELPIKLIKQVNTALIETFRTSLKYYKKIADPSNYLLTKIAI